MTFEVLARKAILGRNLSGLDRPTGLKQDPNNTIRFLLRRKDVAMVRKGFNERGCYIFVKT